MTALLTQSTITPTTSSCDDCIETVTLEYGESLRFSPAWPILQRAYFNDTQATFDQMPEYIETVLTATSEWKDRPAVIVYRESTTEGPIAAIFIPKNVSTKKIPAFGLNCTLRGYRLVGNRLLGVSHDASAADQLVATALEQLAKRRSQMVLIEDLDVESPLSQYVNSHLPQSWHQFAPRGWQTRHRLHFPSTSRQSYWDKFSSKTRNTFRRGNKKIGNIRIARVTEPSGVVDFLRDAHRVSLETWQSQTLGLRIKNDERELTTFGAMATMGAFRSYLLYREEQPIAFVMGTQSHGTFLMNELGYDQAYSRYSPGQVLLVHILDDLIDDPEISQLDFGFGHAGYKEIFGTHLSRSADIWLMPENWTTTLVRMWGGTSQWLSRSIKSVANQIGVTSRLRKALRRLKSHVCQPATVSKQDKTTVAQASEPTAAPVAAD
ncbi:MAG: GNAT family N-acetyltransferase [Planctomycetota bacterium]|nr:GNAT family N-acetyltransferase [Planctomycetota bacterium]MDA1212102.1 GNAT family N-acetyltransferase [Planctomycetota bacterium]